MVEVTYMCDEPNSHQDRTSRAAGCGVWLSIAPFRGNERRIRPECDTMNTPEPSVWVKYPRQSTHRAERKPTPAGAEVDPGAKVDAGASVVAGGRVAMGASVASGAGVAPGGVVTVSDRKAHDRTQPSVGDNSRLFVNKQIRHEEPMRSYGSPALYGLQTDTWARTKRTGHAATNDPSSSLCLTRVSYWKISRSCHRETLPD